MKKNGKTDAHACSGAAGPCDPRAVLTKETRIGLPDEWKPRGKRDGPGANTHLRADLRGMHHQLHRPGGAVGIGAADRQGFRYLDHRTRLSVLGLPVELPGLRAALGRLCRPRRNARLDRQRHGDLVDRNAAHRHEHEFQRRLPQPPFDGFWRSFDLSGRRPHHPRMDAGRRAWSCYHRVQLRRLCRPRARLDPDGLHRHGLWLAARASSWRERSASSG